GAVLVMEAVLLGYLLARPLEELGQPGRGARGVVGVEQVEKAAVGKLLGAIAPEAGAGRAAVEDRPVRPEQNHRVGAILDQRAEAPFALLERGLRLDLVGGPGGAL